MTTQAIKDTAVQELAAGLRGDLIRPGDAAYESARKVWNGMIDKRPAMIVRCAGVADVIRAVNFARDNGMLVAVRGGGHNVAGNAVCDDGIVIDLSPMKGMWVDPNARTARAQAGLTIGEFDQETQAFGLATTLGTVSMTGIAGLTLGGGLGWLMRKHGLACDNLVSADIVTADGRSLKVSDTENSDLFWAVRGGGGNFGIVTSFEYRLHPVGTVVAGMVAHPADKAPEVLRFYREFCSTAPDELTAFAGLLTDPEGNPAVVVIVCYTGDVVAGERVVEPVKRFGKPYIDEIGPMPYTQIQSLFDADPSSQPGYYNYLKSDFLTDLSDQAIDLIAEHFATVPSPMSFAFIEYMGGAVGRVAPDATAFAHRSAPYNFIAWSTWNDPSDSERQIKWARGLLSDLQPYAAGGVYTNYMGEEGDERVKLAYGPNHDRLVAVKNKYDPTNLFHLNQNIKPTV